MEGKNKRQCVCSVVSDSFATLWTAAHQASLSFTISQTLLKFMSIESVMSSNHLIFCRLLLLPTIFPSIRGQSKHSFKKCKYFRLELQKFYARIHCRVRNLYCVDQYPSTTNPCMWIIAVTHQLMYVSLVLSF